jgi:hypothetical protein
VSRRRAGMYAPRRRPRRRRAPEVTPERVAQVQDSIRLAALREGRKLTHRQVAHRVEQFLLGRYFRERRGLPKTPGP